MILVNKINHEIVFNLTVVENYTILQKKIGVTRLVFSLICLDRLQSDGLVLLGFDLQTSKRYSMTSLDSLYFSDYNQGGYCEKI